MLDQQNQKHDSKKSELWKMSMSFTKSIIMPTKVIDTDGELNEAKKKKVWPQTVWIGWQIR